MNSKWSQMEFEERLASIPQCPVFQPTTQEFNDVAKFINSIRPQAEKHGICKIIPPASWKPPFCLDTKKLRFKTRDQRVNSLDGEVRSKINFFESLEKFLMRNGKTLTKLPTLEKKPLDLHKLYRCVISHGGHEQVTANKLWSEVARDMGLKTASNLKDHYIKHLGDYEEFKRVPPAPPGLEILSTTAASRSSLKPSRPKSSASAPAPSSSDQDPPPPDLDDTDFSLAAECLGSLKTKQVETFRHVRVDEGDYICEVCQKGNRDELLLLCDLCDGAYHTFCLSPKLHEVPSHDWFCPECIQEDDSGSFGFGDGKKYTISSYKRMADQYKRKMLGSLNVPSSEIELTYWTLAERPDLEMEVEYGSELHTSKIGSGFPKGGNDKYCRSQWNLNNLAMMPSSLLHFVDTPISGVIIPWIYIGMCFSTFCWHVEDHYMYSINYIHEGSTKLWYGVSGHDADLFERVMKETLPELFDEQPDLLFQIVTTLSPTLLMERGVPIVRAEQNKGEFIITFPRSYHGGFNQGFNIAESCNFALADWIPWGWMCKERYREFKKDPVFCHERLLIRLLQKDKSYLTSMWLRDEIEGMRDEEIRNRNILKTTGSVESGSMEEYCRQLGLEDTPDEKSATIYTAYVRKKKKTSRGLGAKKTEGGGGGRYGPQDDDDDEGSEADDYEHDPTCLFCHGFLYLSCVTCACLGLENPTCVNHAFSVCSCGVEKKTLWVRYQEEELDALVHKAHEKADAPLRWSERAETFLALPPITAAEIEQMETVRTEPAVHVGESGDGEDKMDIVEQETDAVRAARPSIQQVLQLVKEGEQYKGVTTIDDLRAQVKSKLKLAEQWSERARKFSSSRLGTRKTQSALSDSKFSLPALEGMLQEAQTISVQLEDLSMIKNTIQRAMAWQETVKTRLPQALTLTSEELESLMTEAQDIGVSLPECSLLGAAIKEAEWRETVQSYIEEETRPSLREAESMLARGVENQYDSSTLAKLEEMVNLARAWLVKAEMQTAGTSELAQLHLLLEEEANLLVEVDEARKIRQLINDATQWESRAKLAVEQKSNLKTLRLLVNEKERFPLLLEIEVSLENLISSADEWLERATRVAPLLMTRPPVLPQRNPTKKAMLMHGVATKQNGNGVNASGGGDGETEEGQMLDGETDEMEVDECADSEKVLNSNLTPNGNQDDSGRRASKKRRQSGSGSAGKKLSGVGIGDEDAESKAPVAVPAYCVCRTSEEGSMVQCETCKDWFHARCLHVDPQKLETEENFSCSQCCEILGKEYSHPLVPMYQSPFKLPQPSVSDLQALLEEVEGLGLIVDESEIIRKALEVVTAWQHQATSLMETDPPLINLINLHNRSWQIGVDPGEAAVFLINRVWSLRAQKLEQLGEEGVDGLRSLLKEAEEKSVGEAAEIERVKETVKKLTPVYCFCKSPDTGVLMINCENCNDWFHGTCVGITSKVARTLKSHVCQVCVGTRRLPPAKQEDGEGRRRVPRTAAMKAKVVEFEPRMCSVCFILVDEGDDDMGDTAHLTCTTCGVTVHKSCYGLQSVAFEGDWHCDPCSLGSSFPVCELCPVRSGAFKETQAQSWVHLSCALWNPEMYFVEPETRNSVAGGYLETSFPCAVCRSKKGATVQCDFGKCNVSFHAVCALLQGYDMAMDYSLPVRTQPLPPIDDVTAPIEPPNSHARCNRHPMPREIPVAFESPLKTNESFVDEHTPSQRPPKASQKKNTPLTPSSPSKFGDSHATTLDVIIPKKKKSATSTARGKRKYCFCRGPDVGEMMVECVFCEDWFHGDCVGMDEDAAARLQNWGCPGCCVEIYGESSI